jgi:hypothetical protein
MFIMLSRTVYYVFWYTKHIILRKLCLKRLKRVFCGINPIQKKHEKRVKRFF